MRILVTGATGFVGRRLVEQFHRQGHSLWALTRDPEAARRRSTPAREGLRLESAAAGASGGRLLGCRRRRASGRGIRQRPLDGGKKAIHPRQPRVGHGEPGQDDCAARDAAAGDGFRQRHRLLRRPRRGRIDRELRPRRRFPGGGLPAMGKGGRQGRMGRRALSPSAGGNRARSGRRGVRGDADAFSTRRRRAAGLGSAMVVLGPSRRPGRPDSASDRAPRFQRIGERHGPRAGAPEGLCEGAGACAVAAGLAAGSGVRAEDRSRGLLDRAAFEQARITESRPRPGFSLPIPAVGGGAAPGAWSR